MKAIYPILILIIFNGCGNNRTNQNKIENDLATYNLKTAIQTGINILQEAPYNLSGKNQKVAIVDGGKIKSDHKAFLEQNGTSRVFLRTTAQEGEHATHVAGTIGANDFDSNAKGMAPNSKLYSYSYNDSYFASSIKKAFEDDNIYISNHSYGLANKEYLGEYNSLAVDLDKAIYANNNLIACIAAGNDRGNLEYGDYQIIKGPSNAKNILTIGALNDSGDELAYFSSTGPVFDGRVKPDFTIRGSNIYSVGTDNNESYQYMQGTSMATPAATGTIALLNEYYQKILDDNSSHIRFDQIKSILMNSATDLGNIGPDYMYGYGKINAKKAADIISTISDDKPLIISSEIQNDGFEKYTLNITENNTSFRASIAWADLAGESNSDKTLVNDIDMWISDKNRNIIYPYRLDRDNPTLLAMKDQKNHTDNGEIIESILPVGEYYLYIKGEEIQNIQQFTVVTTSPMTLEKKESTELELNEFMNIVLESKS
jgi:subtilisin family serine protease